METKNSYSTPDGGLVKLRNLRSRKSCDINGEVPETLILASIKLDQRIQNVRNRLERL